MSLFHNVRFPLDLALGARGGPERRTDILQLASGGEHRSSPHAHSRRRYDAGVGVKSLDDIQTLIAFFEARGGEMASFRFRDPTDFRADGQPLGIGDGETMRFALVKSYEDYRRPIRLASVESVEPDQGFRVEGGEIVFDAPVADGVEVRATFSFDTVVRFATPRIEVSVEDVRAGTIASIPLVEVLAGEVDS